MYRVVLFLFHLEATDFQTLLLRTQKDKRGTPFRAFMGLQSGMSPIGKPGRLGLDTIDPDGRNMDRKGYK